MAFRNWVAPLALGALVSCGTTGRKPAGATDPARPGPAPVTTTDPVAGEVEAYLADVALGGPVRGMRLDLAPPARFGKGCPDLPPGLCPGRLSVHFQLAERAWALDGKIYRLESRGGITHTWSEATREAYLASFEAGVVARLGKPALRHADREVVTLAYGAAPGPILQVRARLVRDVAALEIDAQSARAAEADALVVAAQTRALMGTDPARCRCEIPIGSRWPQYNGHGMPGPDPGRWELRAVDPKQCTARVHDQQTELDSERSCADPLFDVPIINPAG